MDWSNLSEIKDWSDLNKITNNSEDDSSAKKSDNTSNKTDKNSKPEGSTNKEKDSVKIKDWTDMKQFDDDHDPEWFEQEEKRLADVYGGSFIKVKYTDQGKAGYFCELCLAEMNAKKSLEAHCEGMKHLKKKTLWEKNNLEAKGKTANHETKGGWTERQEKREDYFHKEKSPRKNYRFRDLRPPQDRNRARSRSPFTSRDRFRDDERVPTFHSRSDDKFSTDNRRSDHERFPSDHRRHDYDRFSFVHHRPDYERFPPDHRRNRVEDERFSCDRSRSFDPSHHDNIRFPFEGNQRDDGHSQRRTPPLHSLLPGSTLQSGPANGSTSNSSYGIPIPVPKEKLSVGTTGILLEKLSKCVIKDDDDADLAMSVICCFASALQAYNSQKGDKKCAELLMEALLKLNTMKALKVGLKLLNQKETFQDTLQNLGLGGSNLSSSPDQRSFSRVNEPSVVFQQECSRDPLSGPRYEHGPDHEFGYSRGTNCNPVLDCRPVPDSGFIRGSASGTRYVREYGPEPTFSRGPISETGTGRGLGPVPEYDRGPVPQPGRFCRGPVPELAHGRGRGSESGYGRGPAAETGYGRRPGPELGFSRGPCPEPGYGRRSAHERGFGFRGPIKRPS